MTLKLRRLRGREKSEMRPREWRHRDGNREEKMEGRAKDRSADFLI